MPGEKKNHNYFGLSHFKFWTTYLSRPLGTTQEGHHASVTNLLLQMVRYTFFLLLKIPYTCPHPQSQWWPYYLYDPENRRREISHSVSVDQSVAMLCIHLLCLPPFYTAWAAQLPSLKSGPPTVHWNSVLMVPIRRHLWTVLL